MHITRTTERRTLPWLALLALAACSASPASTSSSAQVAQKVAPASPRTEALAAVCERHRVEQGVVGIRVAVIEDGVIAFHAGFGFADREKSAAVTPETLFRLGSISKPVTAAIAMQLVEEGKLDLDRDVREYAPAARGKLAKITMRQLLSHTSGIRHYKAGKRDNGVQPRTTLQALELFIDDPLEFEPGEKYSYSTHAYTLAVHAIESASKKPFDRLVRERIAERGATTLDCEKLRDSKPQRAKLYDKVEGAPPLLQLIPEDNSWKFGGGGMECTALDLARFGQLMLNDKIVKRATREQMWSPTKLNDGSTSDYGLGWRVNTKNGVVSHSGSQQGCNTALILDPARKRVVCVMMNTQGGGAPDLASALAKELARDDR